MTNDKTTPMTITDLQQAVLSWAQPKGLLDPANAKSQFIKTTEELGEVGRELLHGDRDKMAVEIGDVMVCLTILAGQHGFTLRECLESAWNKIKDRTGETVNGTFIKTAK